MSELATRGPLSIALNAMLLQFYHSGVWNPLLRCDPTSLDHAILLVGYGTEKTLFGSKPYWLIKNRYRYVQWNLWITGTLSAGILSFVGRLSLSQRLTSKPHPSNPVVESLNDVSCGKLNQQFLCRHVQNQPKMEPNKDQKVGSQYDARSHVALCHPLSQRNVMLA